MLKVKNELSGELYPLRMGWRELAEVLTEAYRFNHYCRVILEKQDRYGYNDTIVGIIDGHDSDSMFINGDIKLRYKVLC